MLTIFHPKPGKKTLPALRLLVIPMCLVALIGTSSSAAARSATSGPGAARIVQNFFSSYYYISIPLRYGNSSFGEVHIAKGGSTGNTANHELSSFAKQQWQNALNKRAVGGRFYGSSVFSHQYKTPGGTERTMCVIVDTNDYYYASVNYGLKGIITAFWISGYKSSSDCNNSPG